MKQTAVEWLIESLIKYNIVPEGTHSDNVLFHKAKAMETEQIQEAFYEGRNLYNNWDDSSEQYYNETYGGDK